MAAVYPTSIKTFTTKTNKVDIVDAAHINDLQNEVIALETLRMGLRGDTFMQFLPDSLK